MAEPQTSAPHESTVDALLAELALLADPRILTVNERRGDDHAVNLTKLRAIAKRLKKDHQLARALWATDDTAAKLLALLICRPKEFDRDELDLSALLRTIKERMSDVPDRLQWAMNTCLAQIGITHPDLRKRAIAIGEQLEVLKDYPTPPNCTSPYAPTWIAEMVRREPHPPQR